MIRVVDRSACQQQSGQADDDRHHGKGQEEVGEHESHRRLPARTDVSSRLMTDEDAGQREKVLQRGRDSDDQGIAHPQVGHRQVSDGVGHDGENAQHERSPRPPSSAPPRGTRLLHHTHTSTVRIAPRARPPLGACAGPSPDVSFGDTTTPRRAAVQRQPASRRPQRGRDSDSEHVRWLPR